MEIMIVLVNNATAKMYNILYHVMKTAKVVVILWQIPRFFNSAKQCIMCIRSMVGYPATELFCSLQLTMTFSATATTQEPYCM